MKEACWLFHSVKRSIQCIQNICIFLKKSHSKIEYNSYQSDKT